MTTSDEQDTGGRTPLLVITVLSALIGGAWGLARYGSLEDARSWNLAGLVMITLVFFYASLVGISAWLRNRA